MKTFILLILTFVFSINAIAQDNPKHKEIGLVMSNLNNFGITYRFGNTKSVWRFNTLFLNGSNFTDVTDSLELTSRNMGFEIAAGKEFRSLIAENLELRYGADLSFSYSSVKNTVNDKTSSDNDQATGSTMYKPGINLVLGINYIIKDMFVIGAELLPGFTYSTGTIETYNRDTGKNDTYDITGFNYGISNTSARLTFLYRF